MSNLTVKDLEKLQAEHPDYRMELVSGEIIFMSPSGLESEEVGIEIAAQLRNWVRPRKLGRVLGSSAGFRLPNKDEDIRAPDVSLILAERLPRTTEDYAELVPDLMFEVKSKTDKVSKLRQKIQQFLEFGTKVGVLVDPRTRTLEVYRLNVDKIILRDGDVLEVPELLPGWELPIEEIWAPEFN
ncbi:restriction endonuclease family protein [Lyngbya aestuarii BL J]|uniref:Restriction endonuclease family protein n=1 Tax=Lyngbya aestuarii BL J TaxID=1348334 RepID=U7QKH6_9CYAN|nr:Uma2 family endonuclease [Lyngbya aestuarii]ERT06906.1 restriction endonuclease family protein [Lyngbya aestuarii BL J]